MPTEYCIKLATIAQNEFHQFNVNIETDPPLLNQIKRYYAFLGWTFEGVGNAHPWSAVFISWCVKKAGAVDSEFKFSDAHAVFVKQCIANRFNETGVFRAFKIDEQGVSIGDIIQNNREGGTISYERARTNSNYISHSAIVIATGENHIGKFAITAGGNEHDTVGVRIVKLTADGNVEQRVANPYICIIKNLK